jgi:ATP-dependent protease ClpP protease subunit
VDGFAASAASLIAVCGDKRYMTKNSALLIHQLTGATSGKFSELKDEMTNLNFFMNKVREIYLENTKLNATLLDDLLSSDIWLDSEKCLQYGLVDKII